MKIKIMESSGLRIGNWVKSTHNEGFITVFNNDKCVIKHKYGIEKCYIKDLVPILITEERALKLGGIKRHLSRGNIIDININEDTDIVLPFSDTDLIPCIETYQENYMKEGGDQTVIVLMELKYIHQLQNLYFALTNKELNQ